MINSYKFPSFSSIGSWRSEDVDNQNKVIAWSLVGLLVCAIVLFIVFIV